MAYPLAIFVPELGARSETFIRRHVQDLLPGETVVVAGAIVDQSQHDWDATGPLIDLARISNVNTVAHWLRVYGVRVALGEYLDASLQWLPLADELGIRFFGHAHGYDVSLCLQNPFYRTEYLRYRDAAGVITMSQASRTRLLDLGLLPDRTYAVPYGIDVPGELIEHPDRSLVTVLAAGRMVAKKGPLLTIRAFAHARVRVPSLRLQYVGSGPLFPEVAAAVRTLQLEGDIELLGTQPNATVRQCMSAADIFVQHSIASPHDGDEEGLPVAILEAMAHGLAVVATRHAGIPEAVEDGVTGYLVAEGDTGAMGDAIAELARNPRRRSEMGKAGWERARALFTWDRERDNLLRVMQLR
jgi:colanic acid/amylovoran biosynthesis glycosyltransferase